MTVRDLIKCSAGFLKAVDVEIRDKGKWVYGYRISPQAQIYYGEKCKDFNERRGPFGVSVCRLLPGEVTEVFKWPPAECPTCVMCIEPQDAPAEVLDLEVDYYLPRDTSMTHNDFKMLIVCKYLPELMIEPNKVGSWIVKNYNGSVKTPKRQNDDPEDIEGQMSLDQFYGTEKI